MHGSVLGQGRCCSRLSYSARSSREGSNQRSDRNVRVSDVLQLKDAGVFSHASFRHEFDLVDTKINSLHGARTRTEVNRHLHLFFPEEQLLVILKPNLTDQQRCNVETHTFCSLLCCFLAEIEQAFRKHGFFILAKKMEKLTAEQAGHLEHDQLDKKYHEASVHYLSRYARGHSCHRARYRSL